MSPMLGAVPKFRSLAAGAACIGLLTSCAMTPSRSNVPELQRQVADTERAFAKTMADRDHAAFAKFLSAETIFFSGPKPLQMSPERAARIIRRGLGKGRPIIAFPWLLYAGMKLLAGLPPALADRLLATARVEIRPYE